MADDNNNSNNQQNQQKNKGGGGGGAKGLSLGASFDAAQCKDMNDVKTQALGHAANSFGMIGGMFIAGIAYLGLSKLFKVSPKTISQGQPSGPMNAGQLTGAMFNLRKSDPVGYAQLMGKLPKEPQQAAAQPADAETKAD